MKKLLISILLLAPIDSWPHAGNNDLNMAHICTGNLTKLVRDVGVNGSCLRSEIPSHWNVNGVKSCEQADFNGNWLSLTYGLLKLDATGQLISGTNNGRALDPSTDINDFIFYKTNDKLDCEFSATSQQKGIITTTTYSLVDMPLDECATLLSPPAFGPDIPPFTTPYFLGNISYNSNTGTTYEGVCIKNNTTSEDTVITTKYTGIMTQDKGSMMIKWAGDDRQPDKSPSYTNPADIVNEIKVTTTFQDNLPNLPLSGLFSFIKSQ